MATETHQPSKITATGTGAVDGRESELDPEPTVVGEIGDAEEGNIRVRLVALENIVVALLAGASVSQRGSIRDMATYISPREGKTRHRLTVEAARNMIALLDRADQFKTRADVDPGLAG